MSKIKSYFDTAVALPVGKKLLIPANDFKHMESMRVQLIAERRKWQNAVYSEEELIISRHPQGGKYFVLIIKQGASPPAMILDEDDNIETFITVQQEKSTDMLDISLPSEETIIADAPDTERERMKQAMREDGMSEGEIKAYFGEETDDEEGDSPEVD